MSSNDMLYGNRTSGGAHGDVFTAPEVVRFMLDEVGYTSESNLKEVSILEPSCGEGEFVVEIAKRLLLSAVSFDFDAETAFRHNVHAYDIDADKVEVCRNKLRKLGYKAVENIKVADFLRATSEKADIVVGNPPYIRYENIPEDILEHCKQKFATFHFRSDLYVPFFEKSLSLLKEGGKHCFICSNRWLKNEYGKKLRAYIAYSYQLQLIINMEGANAFQEEVLAYPAITLISAEAPKGTFQYAEIDDVRNLNTLATVHKNMPSGADWTETFLTNTSYSALYPIEEQGFKIGIGVATGADAIFISDKLPDEVENKLIIPAISGRDLRGDQLDWQKKYLLNPYNDDGTLIDLDKYPRAKQYLEGYREKLSARHIAKRTPSRWYRTIDRVMPVLQTEPKILLPDMSGNTFVFVDEGKYYPLHNIYYITGRPIKELKVLAALLMSDFVRSQLASVTNKMNGGFARWQSQHLRKLRLPDIQSMSENDLQSLLDGYSRRDTHTINSAVEKILATPIKRPLRKIYATSEPTLQFAY